MRQGQGTREGDGVGDLEVLITRLRDLQAAFRAQPLGGRLLPLKRLMTWFSASAFDRQAGVIESLIDTVAELCRETDQLRARLHLTRQYLEADPQPCVAGAQGDLLGALPRRVSTAVLAEAEMLVPERLLLYSLVFSLKPQRCLEIGTFKGGSALIICSAMDDNGFGHLVCVDPELKIPPHVLQSIRHRVTLVNGGSPEVLHRMATEPRFDLALIDGDHGRDAVLRDIEATLALLNDPAHLLFHDSHLDEVREAVDEALRRYPDRLVDGGELSVTRVTESDEGIRAWGGLRLLRACG